MGKEELKNQAEEILKNLSKLQKINLFFPVYDIKYIIYIAFYWNSFRISKTIQTRRILILDNENNELINAHLVEIICQKTYL